MKKLLDGKTFQIILKRNDNQPESIFFSDFHEYAMYCGIAWRQTFQECFEFITFHYSNCCILSVKKTLNNRETDWMKSAQYKVKSLHYKWLLLITENHLKNLTNFSSTHEGICVKDATSLRLSESCLQFALHFPKPFRYCKWKILSICFVYFADKRRSLEGIIILRVVGTCFLVPCIVFYQASWGQHDHHITTCDVMHFTIFGVYKIGVRHPNIVNHVISEVKCFISAVIKPLVHPLLPQEQIQCKILKERQTYC